MSVEVPEDWKTAKVGDLVSIKTGKLDANAAVKGGQYKFFTCSRNDYEIDSYSFDADAIIIAGNGDLNVKRYCGKFDAYQRTYVLTSKNTNILDTNYFFFWESIYVDRLRDLSIGGVIKYIKLGMLADVEIPIPPLPEQQRIAEILSSVDESIRATEAVIAQAERVKRGLMEDLLTGGLGSAAIANGEVPDGWRIGCFGELATVKSGFAFKSSDFCDYSQDAVAVIRMSDLKSGAVTFETAACVPLDVVNGLERFELQEGDFLFGMSGSLGNYGVVPKTSKRLFLNQRVGKLSPNKSDHRFLAHVFTSEKFVEEIYRNASGNAQANISGKQIESIEIPIPPLPEQQRIAEILSSVDDQITTNRATVEQLQRLKRGLMDDLLTGKVRTVA